MIAHRVCRLLGAALRNQTGSILVSAVVVATLLSIVYLDLIRIVTSSLNNDTASYEDLRAFHAAESGVWMAARWLRGHDPMQNYSGNPFNNSLSINNLQVTPTITLVNGVATITSDVYKGATFLKRIAVGNVSLQTFGKFQNYFGDFAEPGISQTSEEGMSGEIFTGATFFNKLWIGLNVNTQPDFLNVGTWDARIVYSWTEEPVKFLGPLGCTKWAADSLKSFLDKNPWGFSDIDSFRRVFPSSHFGNNYSYTNGILLGAYSIHNYGGWTGQQDLPWQSPTTQVLDDSIFTDKFIPQQDLINEAASTLDPARAGIRIDLPVSQQVSESETAYAFRPTLTFNFAAGVATAIYSYKVRSGNQTIARDDTFPYTPNTPNGTLFFSNTFLNVRGTVAGHTTIATAAGMDMVPIGNIITPDYNTATGKINDNSNTANIIGLAPGGQFHIMGTWQDNNGNNFLVDPTYASTGNKGTLHIVASILALNTVGTQKCGIYPDRTVYDSFPDPRLCHFDIKIFGNRICAGWMTLRDKAPPSTSRGLAGSIYTTADPRLMTNQPPGYRNLQTVSGLTKITLSGWGEVNKLP